MVPGTSVPDSWQIRRAAEITPHAEIRIAEIRNAEIRIAEIRMRGYFNPEAVSGT